MSEYWNPVAVLTWDDPYQLAEDIRECFNGTDARVVGERTEGEVYIERCYDDVDSGWYEIAAEHPESVNPGEEIENMFDDHSTLSDKGARCVFDYTNNEYLIEMCKEE